MGRVLSVSPDAVTDQRMGAPYVETSIELDSLPVGKTSAPGRNAS
jgi:hypothetical protein